MENLSLQEKVRGSLMAGALGDAYGGRFQNTDVPTRNEQWRFGDETHLTFGTCGSILQQQQVDPAHLAFTFADLYRKGRLNGMGACTLQAMVMLKSGVSWEMSGARGDYAAGDGAATRVAPLAFLLDPMQESQRAQLETCIRITHHDAESVTGALAVVMAIRGIQNDRQSFLQQVIRNLPQSEVTERLVEMGKYPGMSLRSLGARFGSGGWVVESVPLALMAAQQAVQHGLGPVLRELAAFSRCPDAQCSLAGQVAGAFLGPAGLPADWMVRLEKAPQYTYFLTQAQRFADFVLSQQGIRTLF